MSNLLTFNRISPRTIAAAIVRIFNLNATLDEKTREVLQIYQPLIAQAIGLPEAATVPNSTAETRVACPDGESKPPVSVEHEGDGEKKALSEDKHATNVLLVDDNEVNLRVCFPAI